MSVVATIRDQVRAELERSPARVRDVLAVAALAMEAGGCQKHGVRSLAMALMDADVPNQPLAFGDGYALTRVKLGNDLYHAITWNELPVEQGVCSSLISDMKTHTLTAMAFYIWPELKENKPA